jgi:hypothetical protein
MALLSTLLTVESARAYPNLYDITITSNITTLNDRLRNLTNLATKVDFEENFGFTFDHNDAIQAFMMKNVNRIKGVNVTFKETSSYSVIAVLKDWIDAIYNFEDHYYYDNIDPTGTIKINLEAQANKYSFTLLDIIPKSLSYPSYSWSDSNPIEIQASFTVGRIIWTKVEE